MLQRDLLNTMFYLGLKGIDIFWKYSLRPKKVVWDLQVTLQRDVYPDTSKFWQILNKFCETEGV
jgi:hypothetical protein